MLGVVLCFIYQAWHEDYGNRLPAAPVAQTAQAPEGRAAETAATADQTGDTAAAVSSDGQTLRVETDVYIAEISTLGGEIRRIELKQYPANKDKPEPMSLLDDRSEEHTSELQSLMRITYAV